MAQNTMPGRITPGLPDRLNNIDLMHVPDLKLVGLSKPAVLQAYVNHLSESTGMLSEILAHTGSKHIADALNGNPIVDMQNTGGQMLKSRLKVIGNHEFIWQGKRPQGFVYSFTRTVASPETTTLNGAEFTAYIDNELIDPEDMLLLDDLRTQIKVVRKDSYQANPGETRIVARLIIDSGTTTQYVNPMLLRRGSEAARFYNQKPSVSTFGSKVGVGFGDWYKESLSTIRWEWNISDMAQKMQITNPNAMVPMAYTYQDADGQNVTVPYMVNALDYELDKEMWKSIDNMLFAGKADVDSNGKFKRDARGYEYISGNGLVYQQNSRLCLTYNNFNSAFMDQMFTTFRMDSGKTPWLLAMGGVAFRGSFDRYMRETFRVNPEVLYWSNQGPQVGEGFLKNGVQGFRSNFKVYSTAIGHFIVGDTNYFDAKHMPSGLRMSDGTNYNSHSAYILNVTDNFAGGGNRPAFDLVTLKDSFMREGKLASLTDNNGGYFSTPEDISSKHKISRAGIACFEPNMLMEVSKPLPRY